jgi:large subunit ribosomal protein L3
MKGLIGKKIGMTQIYAENGTRVPVTVLEAGPCRVIAQRTQERDGYSALQIGYGDRKARNVSKAVRTQAEAAGYVDTAPERIREIRLEADPAEAVGDELGCTLFAAGEFVDVTGTSKGRGFQGVVKRHGFAGGRETHGGDWTRRPGSIGMCEHPGRVYKGRKMPGQMGNVRRTVQNLEIIQVREEDNLILVKGAIPGPNGGLILIRQARKKGGVSK